jgi:hypothetical protein
MHCAFMVQSVAICVLALFVITVDQERRDMNLEERMWGYTEAAGLVQALATGYLLFDLVVMVRYLRVFGLGMLAHALSCLLTYTLGFVRFSGDDCGEYSTMLISPCSGRFSTTMAAFSCFMNSQHHFSTFIGSSTNSA